jgi:two-component system response regulator AtoC
MRATNILVVDVDPQMQFFLKEALQRQSYGVTVKGSAEEALTALRTDRYDLVLLDVGLPGMPGLEAVDEILKIDRGTPIIIMTAHGTRETAFDAMRRGAYDYFTKPFRVDELEIVIRRALEKRSSRRRAGAAGWSARARHCRKYFTSSIAWRPPISLF